MTARRLLADMTESRDRKDMIDPVLIAEPIDIIDANEPIEPTHRIEPTEPIDSTEPFDPIERKESSDHRERREFLDGIPSACRTRHPGAALSAHLVSNEDGPMELHEAVDAVGSREQLADFAKRLSRDFADQLPDDWVNLTVDDYLESVSGWLEDAERLDDLHLPADAWRTAAKILYMGKIYE